VELYGLKPNGQPINSNPYSKHSDGDGLEDNEELHFSREKMTYELDKSQYDGSVFVCQIRVWMIQTEMVYGIMKIH